MAEDIARSAAEIAATVTGSGTPDAVRIARSTRLSELSLFAALLILALFALIMTGVLALHAWQPSQAAQVVHFLGWGLLLAIGGILLVIMALCSPWIGHVEATAGAAHINLEGRV